MSSRARERERDKRGKEFRKLLSSPQIPSISGERERERKWGQVSTVKKKMCMSGVKGVKRRRSIKWL